MLTIQYDITIGSNQFKVNGNNRLIELWCDSSLSTPVNSCRMTFTLPKDAHFKENDAVTVKLGYTGDLHLVFTGKVKSIEWHIGSVQVAAQSCFRDLAALRTNAFFENASAGDIVKGLAGEAKANIGKCDAGLQFPFYAVGNHRSAWQSIHDLAMQCGFDFYANSNDKLVFSKFAAGTPISLEFGKQILKYQMDIAKSPITGVEVFGESPASFGQGTDGSTWFTKAAVKGLAGGGSNVIRQYIPAARTQELAKQMATALWENLKLEKKGVVTLLGKANIAIGTTIEIAEMPVSSQNGSFKVIGCCHTIRKNTGFLTQLIISGF
jgi:hypothetical protein